MTKHKYYFEIIDKTTGDYIFQSKFFRTPKAVEKWLSTNIDYIDFNSCGAYIMIAEFENDCCNINKYYSYIDIDIFYNLKETYKNEQ